LGKRERGGGINRQGKSSSCCGVLTGTQRIGKDGVDIRGAFHDCDFCADITLDDLVSGTNRVAAVEGGFGFGGSRDEVGFGATKVLSGTIGGEMSVDDPRTSYRTQLEFFRRNQVADGADGGGKATRFSC